MLQLDQAQLIKQQTQNHQSSILKKNGKHKSEPHNKVDTIPPTPTHKSEPIKIETEKVGTLQRSQQTPKKPLPQLPSATASKKKSEEEPSVRKVPSPPTARKQFFQTVH